MKNIFKTAVGVSVLAAAVVMAEVANAASFKFTQSLSNGNAIIGEVEGTLADDMNTVEEAELKWWQLVDAKGEKLLGGEVEETVFKERVDSFSIDGTGNDIRLLEGGASNLYYYNKYNISEAGANFESAKASPFVNIVYIIEKELFREVGTIHQILQEPIVNTYSNENIYKSTWNVKEIDGQTEVPEPSAIVGSLLAVAAGTKVLKRGKKQ